MRFKKSSLLVLVITIGHGSYLSAQAVTGGLMEEIIVTAQKREQNIQDIGITMTAFESEWLKTQSLQTLPDISSTISNIQLFEDYGGHGLSTWVIRGVGLQDFNANNTPTAAIYVDEVYQTSNAMGAVGLFDTERVEVLKGPQGGLYGRNTSGGAINLKTQRASLGEYTGSLKGAYSSWETYGLDAASNIPLGDRAAVRVAGNRQFSEDAWQTSLVNNSQHGEKDLWSLRSWLLFEPDEDTKIQWKLYGGANNSEINLGRSIGLYDAAGNYCDAVLHGARDDLDCYNLAGVSDIAMGLTPVSPSVQASDGSTSLSQPLNQLDNEYSGMTLILDRGIGSLTVTSVTNLEAFDYRSDMDFDGTPQEFGHNLGRSEIAVWSQEFRLVSRGGEPLSWILGLFVSKEDFEENREFLLRDSIVSPLQIGELHYEQNTDSGAVYGNLAYDFSEGWQLNSSFRYTDEKKYYRNGTVAAPAFPPPFDFIVKDLASDYTLGSRLSGNIGFNWEPSDHLLLYASVSRGFKAGGFFGGFPLDPEAVDHYKEETVVAYELGFKSRLREELILNGAVFHYDYRDVQGYINEVNPVTETILEFLANQGDARHYGLEVELYWAITNNLNITANAGYLDAEIIQSKAVTTNLLGDMLPVRGKRPYAPKWSAFFSASHRTDFSNGIHLTASIDYNYRTEFSGELTSPVDYAVKHLDGYGLFNGAAALTSDSNRWTLSVWGKNLADREYVPRVVFDSFGSFMDIPGEPRSWGIALETVW